MFLNFIKNLCDKEGLIDIGEFGTVTQSSLSKWSKDEDSKRAVSNVEYKDFLFHTDKHENPWWEIKFNRFYNVRHIIISNRKRKPFDKIASKIKVTCIYENDEEVVVHSGDLTFGSLPESLPLILSFYNDDKIKCIRITLPKCDYLHLGSINILSNDIFLQKKINKLAFFSVRRDGFGERLKALLNSIVLAKTMDGEFYFSWDSRYIDDIHHDTKNVESIFDKNFIKNHFKTNEEISKYSLQPIKLVPKLELHSLKEFDGLIVQQSPLKLQVKDENIDFQKISYFDAFNSILFTSSMEEVKKLAFKVPLRKKSIAIHLRAGDIVYGTFRFTNHFYGKVIPIYLLDFIIKKYKADDYDIIIFGQDKIFCESVCCQYSLKYSNNLIEDFYEGPERALFDIVLMSRCIEIVAGASGFATVATWIGGGVRKSYDSIISSDEARKAFIDFREQDKYSNSSNVTPLLKSFSLAHFYDSYSDTIDINEKIDIIKEALILDSNNSYYSLILASLYYQKGDLIGGDNILLDCISKDSDYGFQWLSKNKRTNGTTILQAYIKEMHKAMNKGSLAAAFICLLHDYYYLENVNKDFYTKLVCNSKSDVLGKSEIKNLIVSLDL